MSAGGEAAPGPELVAVVAAAAVAIARLQGAARPAVRDVVEVPPAGGAPGPWALAGRIAQHGGRRLPPRRP